VLLGQGHGNQLTRTSAGRVGGEERTRSLAEREITGPGHGADGGRSDTDSRQERRRWTQSHAHPRGEYHLHVRNTEGGETAEVEAEAGEIGRALAGADDQLKGEVRGAPRDMGAAGPARDLIHG
jgi:hypothetical protein